MDPTSQPQVAPQDTPTALAQQIVSVAGTQSTQTQQSSQVPARAKETGPIQTNELAGFVEIVGSDSLEKEPIPPEVASWMEKVSRDTSGEKPPEIVIATPTTPPTVQNDSKSTVFVLPLGEQELMTGKRQGVNNSVRWLSEWCLRIVKKLGNQTTFR